LPRRRVASGAVGLGAFTGDAFAIQSGFKHQVEGGQRENRIPIAGWAGGVLVRFMASGGLKVGGEIGAILGARVGGMDAERVELAARMLPDTAPLIPVEAQSP